jgi:hypothetical protein
MKTILLLLFLPIFGFAQGVIFDNPNFSPTNLVFLQNNRFQYKQIFCKSKHTGLGYYEIKNKTLTLFFETDTTLLLLQKPIVKTTPNPSDSISITVKVFENQSKDTLSFASLEGFATGKKPIFTTSTNFEGIAQLSFKSSTQPLKISASYIGFYGSDIVITPNQNYDLTFFLADNGFDTPCSVGNIAQLNIKNVTEKGFELKNKGKNEKYLYYKIQ